MEVDQMIANVDVNNNGMVDYNEFIMANIEKEEAL